MQSNGVVYLPMHVPIEQVRNTWDITHKDANKTTIYDDTLENYHNMQGGNKLLYHRDNTSTMHWSINAHNMGLVNHVQVVHSMWGFAVPSSPRKESPPRSCHGDTVALCGLVFQHSLKHVSIVSKKKRNDSISRKTVLH